MAADFHPVAILAHMIGVMDHPRREPQRLALERGEDGEIVGTSIEGGIACVRFVIVRAGGRSSNRNAGFNFGRLRLLMLRLRGA